MPGRRCRSGFAPARSGVTAAVELVGAIVGTRRITAGDSTRFLACQAEVVRAVEPGTAFRRRTALTADTIRAKTLESNRTAIDAGAVATDFAALAVRILGACVAATIEPSPRIRTRRVAALGLPHLFTGQAQVVRAVVIGPTRFRDAAFDTNVIVPPAAAVPRCLAAHTLTVSARLAGTAWRCGARVVDTRATGGAHRRTITVLATPTSGWIDAEPSSRSGATTAPARRAADVPTAHLGRAILIEWTAGLRALAGDTCAVGTTALVRAAIDSVTAALAGDGAELTRIWAAKLLAVAKSLTAGVVAALAVSRSHTGRIATGWSALGQPGRTNAGAISGNLVAGTPRRNRRRGRPASGVRIIQHDPAGERCSPEAQQPLEHRAGCGRLLAP